MTRIILLLTSSILCSVNTFAFFCPTNFSQIDFGYSQEQVIKICGQPDTMETKEVPAEGPQEWTYLIPQTVGSNSLTPMKGTLRTQFTFDANNRAINISVNGIGVGSTMICGRMLQLGDSRETVKASCGDASFINKQNGNPTALGSPGKPNIVTTFFYTKTNPPATLVFENDKLTSNNK